MTSDGPGSKVLAAAKSLNFCCSGVHFIHLTWSPAGAWGFRSLMALRGPTRAGHWEHPQPDPPLHATGVSVGTPPKSMTTFECADASFAACAPAEATCAAGEHVSRPCSS